MDDKLRCSVVAALRNAQELIRRDGYQPEWGKGPGHPLNLSNALTRSCPSYDIYLLARQAFSKNWGGPQAGLLHWETYKRHTTSEAIALIDDVILRLEAKICNPTGTQRSREGVL